MKVKQISDIDTALYIYYRYPEIGNKEIKLLFGSLGETSLTKYKKAVLAEQVKQDVKTSQLYTVNTEIAYKVWGIDVADLEKRREKLDKLKLMEQGGTVWRSKEARI